MIDERELVKELEEEIEYQKKNGFSKMEIKGLQYALKLIRLQPKVGEWIPVSKRMPNREEYLKSDGRCICTDGIRAYQSIFDIYDGKFKYFSFRDSGLHEDEITIAWQPLPRPWKGERKWQN